MHEDRSDVPLLAKSFEPDDILFIERLDGPATRVPAENLHAGAAELVGALDRKGETTGDGDVEAESHRHSFTNYHS